jgi:ferredoxin
MIVADQKPLKAIKDMLRGDRKVLAVGCGTCVAVCFAGGKKEVGVLSSALRMASGLDGEPLQVDETTVQRQCDDEYIEPLADRIEQYDAVLSLGCGVGVQSLAERFPNTRILPALDTQFMGEPTEPGVWEERCQGCGNCILDRTAGLCPISRCAKQLMNGPCGGTQDGMCEVDPGIPCVWFQIWDRMAKQGQMDQIMQFEPPKDWSTSRDGGQRRIVREDLRMPEADAS